MHIKSGPQKNKSAAISISETSSNRILVGLSWDMKVLKKVKLPRTNWIPFQKASQYTEDCINAFRTAMYYKYEQTNENDSPSDRDITFKGFDLDLYCYVFDDDHNLIETISPDYTEAINSTETIYHSGEDFTGIGAGDDEQIFIETQKLPDSHKHFIFCVKSDCCFSFDEIENPRVRIADSKTNENFLDIEINPAANINASAFYVAHVTQINGQWTLKTLGDYADFYYEAEKYFKEVI